jgi:hypothetical protein
MQARAFKYSRNDTITPSVTTNMLHKIKNNMWAQTLNSANHFD